MVDTREVTVRPMRRFSAKARAFAGALRQRLVHRDLKIVLASDGAAWIVDSMANAIKKNLSSRVSIDVLSSGIAQLLKNKVIHTLSNWNYYNYNGIRPYHQSNKIVTLWSWGTPEGTSHDPHVSQLIPFLKQMSRGVDIIHVPCNTAKSFLLSLNIDPRKIVHVPQGVDLTTFKPSSSSHERIEYKRRLGIPEDTICVGLFHKDGTGWEDGNEPKLSKGPDVFVDALSHLSASLPVIALIPGPARDYVKHGLEKYGIPFVAPGRASHSEMVKYYYATDVYLIPSREEGGPAGLLEAMATGTPVVSTRCGMASDLIHHGENGFLTDLEDAQALAHYTGELARSRSLREQFSEAGLETIKAYDWKTISNEHYEKLYSPLLRS